MYQKNLMSRDKFLFSPLHLSSLGDDCIRYRAPSCFVVYMLNLHSTKVFMVNHTILCLDFMSGLLGDVYFLNEMYISLRNWKGHVHWVWKIGTWKWNVVKSQQNQKHIERECLWEPKAMAGYGYAYRSISTYSTVRDESRGPVTKPFVPFVPNTNSNSEAYVTKKTIVPVATKPYGDDYPAKGDGYGSPRKVDEFLTKVQNEASRPKKFTPVSSTDWRQSSQPPPTYNNGANGYGDYGSNKEAHKPVGVAIKNDNYDGHNGYGDYGSSKELRKPIGSAIRNDSYNGYNGPNGYGDYGNKEGRKLVEGPIRSDNYGSHNNPHGFGDYGNYVNKEGRKPVGGSIKDDKYDGYDGPNGYGDYGNKEGRKPVGGTIRSDKYDGYNTPNDYGGYDDYNSDEGYKSNGSPIRNGNYDGYNGAKNGYGGYGNKEGHKPYGSTTRDDNYDGYHSGNGYGDDGNYGNKEGYKPPSSPVPSDNYDRHRPGQPKIYGTTKEPIKIIPSKPKIGYAWTASPRKGTQLSEPTNDIDKAVQMLKEAAKLSGHGNKGGHNYDDYHRKHDEPTSKFGKGMELVKEVEELKNIVKPSTPNKDYGNATGRYGNFNFLSRPRTPPTHVADFRDNIDGRDDAGRYGIIDSRKAEKLYNGKRV
ncbi:hypothetical protein RIF29_21985 [Crotalaria pallida]|uniref:Uncharacterized protein n=1 Tax=Crotalaria pallida TaxID=3830 RepID=A0AAN9F437_CROPI